MPTLEKLINTESLVQLFIYIVIIYSVLSSILQYLIKTNKIKPSKISRIFYADNENFIKSWEKNKGKGLFIYVIKMTIQITFIMGIWGVLFKIDNIKMFGYDQSKTIFIALIAGLLLGLTISAMRWIAFNNRYNKLIKKAENNNREF